jgi:hypothetical protein
LNADGNEISLFRGDYPLTFQKRSSEPSNIVSTRATTSWLREIGVVDSLLPLTKAQVHRLWAPFEVEDQDTRMGVVNDAGYFHSEDQPARFAS